MTKFTLKPQDALKILNLTGEVNPDIIKRAYREACAKYHPDRNPAGEEMMKAVNQAYEVLKDFTGQAKSTLNDFGDSLNDAINFAINLPGVKIEIMGAWVWLTGNTLEYKDQINAFEANGEKFRWSGPKVAWYFRPSDYKSYSRGKYDLDQIREKYGSKEVNRAPTNRLKYA